jgi:hypothetical protein
LPATTVARHDLFLATTVARHDLFHLQKLLPPSDASAFSARETASPAASVHRAVMRAAMSTPGSRFTRRKCGCGPRHQHFLRAKRRLAL